MSMRKNLIDHATVSIAAYLETEYAAALRAKGVPVDSPAQIRKRCEITDWSPTQPRTLIIDGVPTLEIYPVQFQRDQTDTTGFTHTCRQRVRRLYEA